MASEAWLEEMSQAIVSVTKGFDKPDRRYAYDFLRTHVKVSELHEFAIRKFNGKEIDFGEGSLNPRVVVVTKERITKDQKARLNQAWKKLDIPEDEVYYAYLRYVKTKQKQEIRQQILDRLVNALNPDFVLAFDGVKVEYDGSSYQTSDPVTIVTEPDKADERKEMMKALKDLD